MTKIRLGTRGSPLALAQAALTARALEAAGLQTETVVIHTQGDRDTKGDLAKIGGVGVFAKEIEEALLDGRVDLAVHSAKDLPTKLPEELMLAACLPREDVRDVLISKDNLPLDRLPSGARVGTGSPRRRAQLQARRPDLDIVPIRGNVDTRIRKVRSGELAATILAAAGLHRLGLKDEIAEYLDFMLNAPGQAAVALEVRSDDAAAREAAGRIGHAVTLLEITAERRLLAELGAGCHAPLAALARVSEETLSLHALVAHPSGAPMIGGESSGPAHSPDAVAVKLSGDLLALGARELLAGG